MYISYEKIGKLDDQNSYRERHLDKIDGWHEEQTRQELSLLDRIKLLLAGFPAIG
jgi:hypothetical protein